MRAIIPCAGYGMRMNMRPDQSKEMLPDPERPRLRIIDYSLLICKLFNLEPLIVTRADKKDLIYYVSDKCEFQIIEPEGEWPTTVLKSQEHWHDENILILPDTRFDSVNVVEEMRAALEFGDVYAIATHRVRDADKWGMLEDVGNKTILYEKPKNWDSFGGCAWGLLAWRRMAGLHLFSGAPVISLGNVSSFRLKSFKDITRQETT